MTVPNATPLRLGAHRVRVQDQGDTRRVTITKGGTARAFDLPTDAFASVRDDKTFAKPMLVTARFVQIGNDAVELPPLEAQARRPLAGLASLLQDLAALVRTPPEPMFVEQVDAVASKPTPPANPPSVRWMIRKDLDAVLGLDGAHFSQPWDDAALTSHLMKRNAIGMVAESPTGTTGFMVYDLERNTLRVRRIAGDAAAITSMLDKLGAKSRTAIVLDMSEVPPAVHRACLDAGYLPRRDGTMRYIKPGARLGTAVPSNDGPANPNATVRWMLRGDSNEVLDIDAATTCASMSDDDLVGQLRQRNVIGMVVEDNDSVVGFALYGLHKGRLEFIDFGVDPDRHGEGFATALFDHIDTRKLSVNRPVIRMADEQTDDATQRFFASRGYQVVDGRLEKRHDPFANLTPKQAAAKAYRELAIRYQLPDKAPRRLRDFKALIGSKNIANERPDLLAPVRTLIERSGYAALGNALKARPPR